MTVLCPATGNERQLQDRIGDAPVWFPLFADPEASLADHLRVLEYAPASARYGPYADNILGMNWELPDGEPVRIGERVVKNSTGYDLMRFLLHAPFSFGRATEYVLRLRARQAVVVTRQIHGEADSLDSLRRQLLRSPWRHVIDAIDWIFELGHGAAGGFLQISIDTEVPCLPAFDVFFETLYAGQALTVRSPASAWRHPLQVSAAIKSTADDAVALAAEIHREHGRTVLCHTVSGYVVVYAKASDVQLDPGLLEAWQQRVAILGGHVRAEGFYPSNAPDRAWIEALLENFKRGKGVKQ